ncbi:MAG: response regulator [Elusimicrobiota bacterium]|nr:MAG: response regulator [Elusimicrobiota bacterium]
MAKKLLIVDDNDDVRMSLRLALESFGDIVEAGSGAEALRLIASERPRAVVLDISMPGMGGLEVLRAARAGQPALAVVMLTGEMDLEVARECLEAGARSYVTKPFDAQTLRSEIKRLLETGGSEGEADARPWRVAGEKPQEE